MRWRERQAPAGVWTALRIATAVLLGLVLPLEKSAEVWRDETMALALALALALLGVVGPAASAELEGGMTSDRRRRATRHVAFVDLAVVGGFGVMCVGVLLAERGRIAAADDVAFVAGLVIALLPLLWAVPGLVRRWVRQGRRAPRVEGILGERFSLYEGLLLWVIPGAGIAAVLLTVTIATLKLIES